MKKSLFVFVFGLWTTQLLAVPIYFPTEEPEGGFLNLKTGIASLGAEFETEFLVPRGEDDLAFNSDTVFHTNRKRKTFRIDKLSIIPRLNLDDKIKFHAEIEALTTSDEVERTIFRESHVTFNFPYHLFLKFGLEDRFISPEFMAENNAWGENRRLTEVYPINGTAFWKDEDIGFIFGGDHPFAQKKGTFFWRTGLTNGLFLAHDHLTRNQIYPLFQDDRDAEAINIDLTDRKELAAGLGAKYHFSDIFYVGAMAFFINSRLNTRDIDFLADVINGYTSRARRNQLAGFNFEVNASMLNFFAQYIHSQDGKIERDGYYIQPSVYLDTEVRNYLNSLRILYRYNDLDVEVRGFNRNIPASPFTWDRQTHTLGLHVRLYRSVMLKTEFHFNEEDPGDNVDEVKNDEFLTQLEIRF